MLSEYPVTESCDCTKLGWIVRIRFGASPNQGSNLFRKIFFAPDHVVLIHCQITWGANFLGSVAGFLCQHSILMIQTSLREGFMDLWVLEGIGHYLSYFRDCRHLYSVL